MLNRKPAWVKKKFSFDNINVSKVKKLITDSRLHTVCQSAQCPNIYECFSKKTATFMLMGNICTRNCAFCGVTSGKPQPLDKEEPKKVAQAVKEMGLNYVVLTSVTRDDLEDGGAGHFAETIRAIKDMNPGSRIECLIPDLKGSVKHLETILDCDLEVLNHNIETIADNYLKVRPQANYYNSLKILNYAKSYKKNIYTKSGFMVGLGEAKQDIKKLLLDLKDNCCDILTIGQYLRPGKKNTGVKKYYRPEEFKKIEDMAKQIGFKYVFSGIFVRSSYHAADVFKTKTGN
ncbi:MAG: lipoyl synthase [Actinomycetota bacterium]